VCDFRRARFFIFAPDSQAKHACRQAEFPLNALFKIPEPPLVFGDAAIIEIVMLAGFYRTVSYLTNVLRLPLEHYAARFPL
jgi:hypothetical protein